MNFKKNNTNIRIFLTALVLIVGGYYIQKSASKAELSNQTINAVISPVSADTPVEVYIGGK